MSISLEELKKALGDEQKSPESPKDKQQAERLAIERERLELAKERARIQEQQARQRLELQQLKEHARQQERKERREREEAKARAREAKERHERNAWLTGLALSVGVVIISIIFAVCILARY